LLKSSKDIALDARSAAARDLLTPTQKRARHSDTRGSYLAITKAPL